VDVPLRRVCLENCRWVGGFQQQSGLFMPPRDKAFLRGYLHLSSRLRVGWWPPCRSCKCSFSNRGGVRFRAAEADRIAIPAWIC